MIAMTLVDLDLDSKMIQHMTSGISAVITSKSWLHTQQQPMVVPWSSNLEIIVLVSGEAAEAVRLKEEEPFPSQRRAYQCYSYIV